MQTVLSSGGQHEGWQNKIHPLECLPNWSTNIARSNDNMSNNTKQQQEEPKTLVNIIGYAWLLKHCKDNHTIKF